MTLHTQSIAQLGRLLAAGKVSSYELTQHFLDRIVRINPQLNALILPTHERAMADAKAADAAIQQGQHTPLTGIPLVHKDLFCTKGITTSCASRMLSHFVPPYESTVTWRLQTAGTVLLGKANMDEFAMGSSNENSYYGPVKNPWDETAIAGGSSGGSAAAVAASLACAATGTDTGGSIRQPASHCGVTGLKPTYGRVSRWGMAAFASSLDQAGTFTRTAEDAALLLGVMAGFDEKDTTSVSRDVPDFTQGLGDSVSGLTIGLPEEYFAKGLDPQVETVIQAAIQEWVAQGAKVKSIHLPHTHLSVAAYYVIASAEASSNLSRYDGVRYGHRCENPKNLEDLYARSRSEGFGEEVKRRILTGTYALSAGYFDAYYLKAQKIRRLIQNDFIEAFKSVDVIMGPVAPTAAFDLGSKNQDPVAMYLSDIYTLSANLAGLPGMSIPAGFAGVRPVGVQMIGNFFAEAQLLNCAHQFQQATDWHQKQPAAFV